MVKENRLIALIDFSKYTDTVIQFTHAFAELLNAEVVFLHRTPGLVPARASVSVMEQFLETERNDAYQRLKDATDVYFTKPPSILVGHDSLQSRLAALADDDFTNWVFVGLKGTGTLKKLFIGSTAAEIINETSFSTVAIPLSAEFIVPKEFVISVNPDIPLDVEHLETVLENFSAPGQKISFMSVVKEGEQELACTQYLQEITAAFNTYDASFEVFRGKNAYQEIQSALEHKDPCFLVVQRGGRALTDLPFKKFLINELVYNGSIPLIIL